MKAKLKGFSEDQKFKLSVPLEEFLVAALGEKEREMYRDCEVDVYVDSSRNDDGPDDEIVISFYKSRSSAPNEQGLLVETPREKMQRCASKKDLEKLKEEFAAEIEPKVDALLRHRGIDPETLEAAKP